MEAIVNLSYLIAVTLLIVGLRRLSSPATARSGNLLAAVGMGLAIVSTILSPIESGGNNYTVITLAMVTGTVIGLIMANRVQMTAMPELVSLFNGLGGACAVSISLIELYNYQTLMASGSKSIGVSMGTHLTTLLAMFVGAVAFTGSLIAYGKLAGKIRDIYIPYTGVLNIALLVLIVALTVYRVVNPDATFTLPLSILIVSLIYGITFVQPIGGADMPVVISLLNAFTGVAAALAGIVYGNQPMIIGGILVGSSGTILTILMCQAMNRSLLNVVIGGFGGASAAKNVEGEKSIVEATANDVAILMRYANQVMIVPGYGMAVAQAQKACKELDNILSEHGVSVNYAIHPVAGRMPGHMNVLLAEADVPYPKLLDLEEANDLLKETDITLVVGANDVVNPAALDDPSSPIYGMPILEILQSKAVVVLKRGMSAGYSGIENPLFYHEKTKMLFGDAKKSIQGLIEEVKSLG
ncbi:MAG: NAD(P)(+) transhydrogenase (Re/Si-specific) subunit beta [Cyclobacteriaceae bacterium]|nr:NAD(P)(+) transhydrogenase (Re/Si-specific) subunit beta [Cyclobacteriaceae bacterium SS2]